MNLKAHYQLDLIFSGPLISQAAGTLKFGVDTAMQRYRKQPVLNGSLVRGNIRSTLEEFSALLDHSLDEKISGWFGYKSENSDRKSESPQTHHYDSDRALVDFDCFWTLQADEAIRETQRIRIAIDEERGTVDKGSLQVIEDCFPAGGPPVTFRGKLLVRYRRNHEKHEFIEWLGKALDYIPAMGSFKGVGFGRVEGWKLTEIDSKKPGSKKSAQLPGNVTRFGLKMTIDRPFCLGRPKTPDSNRIVSADTIGGNVIKALIAREYDNDSKKLNELLCFDDLIISHGLPSKQSLCRREPPLPLSLALVNKKVTDLSSVIDETQVDFQIAPVFKPDWKEKDYRLANRELGRSEIDPDRYLMVRTEIDREHGISKERRLFSLECTDPYDHVWCADIELCRIPEYKRAAVFEKLQAIFKQGLTGMGKTKAAIEFQMVPAFTNPARPSAWRDDLFIVTLVTPARLLLSELTLAGVNSHDGLKKLYSGYWKQQHAGIELKTYFAAQELAGSYYFQRKHRHEVQYRPEWLTVAGSVFVLRISDPEALKLLEDWQKTGLPAHSGLDRGRVDWRTTPYLPEHGFGEIIVNDPKQLDLLYVSAKASA
ncbi:MAG: hypothetical protein ACRERU_16045 [Methylococcales bacterium]